MSLGILHISKTCSNAMLAVRFAKAASLIENVIYKTKEDIKKYAVILSKLTANGQAFKQVGKSALRLPMIELKLNNEQQIINFRLPHLIKCNVRRRAAKKKNDMQNSFTITDPEKTLLVSVQFESNVNADDKEKLVKIISMALDLWEGKEKFSEELQKALDKNGQ